MDKITELQQPRTAESRPRGSDTVSRPEVKVIGRYADATVVRLAFAPGDALPEHKAARPIIVMGQTGRVRFTAEGSTVVIQPGTAVHLDAGIPHDLFADEASTVTLIIVSGV